MVIHLHGGSDGRKGALFKLHIHDRSHNLNDFSRLHAFPFPLPSQGRTLVPPRLLLFAFALCCALAPAATSVISCVILACLTLL